MGDGKIPLSDQHISLLLSTASTYGNTAAKSFALFITVLFGSLGFATALAHSNASDSSNESTAFASVLIAVALLAFYVINFFAFQSAYRNMTIVLRELSQHIEQWDFKYPETLSVFQPDKPVLGSLGLPSVGYLIGSTLGFCGFVWISCSA